MEFVPQLREVLEKALKSNDPAKVNAAKQAQAELDKVLNSENHRWFIGKMSQEEKDARKKASEEFRQRYAQ